jgi:DNA-binding response OmpR family regulator
MAKRKRILIVDDEPSFRFGAAIALKKSGYKTSEAGDGEEALTLILNAQKRDEPFDLLLVDIEMPKMSGIELMDELKKNDISIPIFAFTGFGNKELIIELLRKGCAEFLDKPFEPQELVKRVGGILHG